MTVHTGQREDLTWFVAVLADEPQAVRVGSVWVSPGETATVEKTDVDTFLAAEKAGSGSNE